VAIGAALAFDASAADAAHGKALYEQCAACHSLKAGEMLLGPSLHGVIGRKAGALDEFRYSPPMKRSGIIWTRETISTFLDDPQKEIPGNRMPFSGMPEAKDRDDLLDYLAQAAKP
jgi:cytochrome c